MIQFFYILRRYLRPLTRKFQFFLINSYYVDGAISRLSYGSNCAFNNAIFNTSSGLISIGDDVAFGYNVLLLTGRHSFRGGKRLSLDNNIKEDEVPPNGYNITIGSGSWIASNVIFIGNSSIGENSIVYAGSIVTKHFPANSKLAGVPAKLIGSTNDD
jgi:acetyltransferase-like isoleucine patch superfamily enzyme